MKKIGISTVHTGYNYGSALQSYATKIFLQKMGYEGEVISLKGSLVKGRDIRLRKIAVMLGRFILNPQKMKKRAEAYQNNVVSEYSEMTKKYFEKFKEEKIKPAYYSWSELKNIARTKEYLAFLCGSDQIWNGDTLYVDPQYYLRYAPKKKRIAFAPSFGREYVADYNKKTIKKYISDFNYLSAREASGVKIIKDLTNLEATQILDPTLLVSKDEWLENLEIKKDSKDEKYILAYFLNDPSDKAKQFINKISKEKKLKIVALPYVREKDGWFDVVKDAGPIEFLSLVRDAECVCTDSFHGTAFSINFQVPYYTFERQYGKSAKQSSRIISLLELTNQMERFNPEEDKEVDFSYSESILKKEREKAKKYLENALNQVKIEDE